MESPEQPGPPRPAVARPVSAEITLTVNGREHRIAVDTRSSLLDVLRERLGLTGAKKGCDHGQCGACTVLLDGRRVNGCLALAVAHDGAEIVTVEGLAADGDRLAPLQEAFAECDAFQCGYCTPGQLCSATGMLEEIAEGAPSAVTLDRAGGVGGRPPTGDTDLAAGAELTDAEIRERMSGNLCRCGAYVNIVAAIRQAAGAGAAARPAGDRQGAGVPS
ncbi:2Fe-2S iron-sulfur cluster-binding protein [Spirillospora sp. CA-255316]